MNDIIWYSRFAVLVGAMVLAVQAVAGRAAGIITLIAVILVCVGFIVFIAALALQGLGVTGLPRMLRVSQLDMSAFQEEESSTGTRDTDGAE